jgi:hypothetical protein
MDAVNNLKKQRGLPFKPGVSGNARGRPKGARNRRTRTLIEAAEAGGDMPLDFLLKLMRDPKESKNRRLEAAKAAAPFLHARLCPVEQKTVDPQKTDATTQIEVRFVPPPKWPDPDDELPD